MPMYQYVRHISSFIKTFTIDDKNYFHVFKNTKNYKMDTEAPIYEQIVQIEAIELHKLSKIIESKGGKVLDLSTDKIICNFPDNILPFELDGDNIIGYNFENEDTSIYKYKIDHKNDRISFRKMENSRRLDIYHPNKNKWNIYNDVNDNDFTPLIETILEKKESFNILGPAGTGKSYLIKGIQKRIR